MKYFKQHFESCDHEWTVYGCFSSSDISPEGDIICSVHDVDPDPEHEHIVHSVYQDYFDPDEVTYITEDEYLAVVNKLREADDYYCKADEVLKSLI